MESRGGNTETKAEGREGGAWRSREARRGLERQPVFSAVGRNLSSLGGLRAFQDTELGEGSGKGAGDEDAWDAEERVSRVDDLSLQRCLLGLMGTLLCDQTLPRQMHTRI